MQVVFLGTGGGRINLINQTRSTAGIRVNGPLNFYLDPGPGSILRDKQFGQDSLKTDVLLVSHSHIDHCNDANLIIEAMTQYTKVERGTVLASKSALEGDKRFDRAISSYHQRLPERCISAKAGEQFDLKEAKVSACKSEHDDPTALGFVIDMEGKRIGYTGDTEYFKGIGRFYPNCDYLVINTLRPSGRAIPGHLDSKGAVRIIKEAAPRLAVITHMGTEFAGEVIESERTMIERESGTKTVMAYDGMILDTKAKKLSEF